LFQIASVFHEKISLVHRCKQSGLIFVQDLSSVTAFAAAYIHPSATLDVLICNAGIMKTPFALSKVISSQSILNRFDRVVSDSHDIAAGRHRTAVPEQSPRPLQTRKLFFGRVV
jgi:NAD(P)-dependent dehydrogenase (short-subunit alcohol dehydrogenase family)